MWKRGSGERGEGRGERGEGRGERGEGRGERGEGERVCARARARVCVCACVCVRACVRVDKYVGAHILEMKIKIPQYARLEVEKL